MPEVVWLQTARADLIAIVEYISDDNPDAAQRVKDDIDAQVETLPDFPKMGRAGRVDGTRELVVLANYIVVYDEDPDLIRILRVIHATQQWPPDLE